MVHFCLGVHFRQIASVMCLENQGSFCDFSSSGIWTTTPIVCYCNILEK